jgi:type IV secretory pathway TraG/TraD family ATPase VirD4
MANEIRKKIRRFKLAPPPLELPIYGRVSPEDCSFIGRTNYEAALEEKKFIFGLKREDRGRHIYIVGKSGMGKSKLLELLIRQDIAYNYGLSVIDPHGDLIESILDFIPESRVEDVVLIDPSDVQYPVSFNPLFDIAPEMKYQLTQDLIEVIKKQFGVNWTSRIEHLFRFICLALLDYPGGTMRGMISMLADRAYRQYVLEFIKDEMVRRFWTTEFADWLEKFDAEAVIPLVNKLTQFFSDPMIRNIFGQKENKIDLEKLMNSKKIILINLAKAKLGEESSSFFGSIFLAKIKQAGMARAKIRVEEREDFYLYMDEFHNLATETFENLLAESRKFGFCLTLSHQYTSQLLPKIQASVLGNVGTIIIFRVSGEDGVKLEPEMAPVFKANDMINLGMRQFYIKMTINGETYDPFSAETLKVLPLGHSSCRRAIIEQSRRKYAARIDEAKRLMEEEEKKISRSAEEKK